jgi:hypothetical protein
MVLHDFVRDVIIGDFLNQERKHQSNDIQRDVK